MLPKVIFVKNSFADLSIFGFARITARTGTGSASGTTISTPVNAATNQLSGGYTYDNNGNLISTGYTYDADNRIEYANAGAVQYFLRWAEQTNLADHVLVWLELHAGIELDTE